MSTYKVTSVSTYWDNTVSTIIVTAPGNDFKANDFVTLSNSDVSILNGSFRVLAASGDTFSLTAPFGPIQQPSVTYMNVALVDMLSITPHIFSETETGMSYLYGMSDFWSSIFEGSEKIDLMLEATSQQASEIYSHFLQLTSSISLDEIQVTTNSQLKLVLLGPDDLVSGTTNSYYLPEVILSSEFILNRPFLPTLTLEEGTHYDITNDGTQITFFQPLDYLSFPVRKTATVDKQYSLWFSNCKLDEQLISTYYGNLMDISPQVSTDKFKAYIYGLFYLFTQGPNLTLIRKGLNLSLGLPLARDYEIVLDIRQYLETDQYLVITDNNQYLIPYGITPSVAIGDNLVPSQEIAQWVEIKDWVHDGKWWANLYIPSTLIPYLPDNENDRHATDGSYSDYVMSNFLKNNTFLVNVNVTSFKDIQSFQQLYALIYKAKPTYTYPVYIWTVPLEEIIPLEDPMDLVQYYAEWCENLSAPIERMKRNLSTNLQLLRGCPQFSRSQVSNDVVEITGGSALINGSARELNQGYVDGYVNYKHQYEQDITGYDYLDEKKAWLRTLFNRADPTNRIKRSFVKFDSNPVYIDDSGEPVNLWGIGTMRIVPLYITSVSDLQDKFDILGLGTVTNAWQIPIYKPTSSGTLINGPVINEMSRLDYSNTIKANFNTLFERGSSTAKPGNFIPPGSFDSTYKPVVTDILPYDYLLAVRIYERAIGIYWVTSSTKTDILPYFPILSFDELVISTTGSTKISRGMGPVGSSYYLLRGAGLGITNQTAPINDPSINAAEATVSAVTNEYTDTLPGNLVQLMDRSGKIITVERDLL